MRRRVLLAAVLALLVLLGILVQSGVFLLRGERVTIHSGSVTLSGMLVSPRWRQEPFPAAVIVHGSGHVRWQDVRGYARRLAPEGMAVLLYDKRGVGGSGGELHTITVDQSDRELRLLAEDAAAAVDFLARRNDIDPTRIGLIGASQAGWIMPLAASRTDRVAFVVAISGPAVSYGQEVYYSQLTGEDPGLEETLDNNEIDARMQAFHGPYGYDPLPVLRQLRIPSLWLLGDADRSVPTSLSVANLQSLQEEDSVPIEFDVYPNGDHGLRDVSNGKRIDTWPRIVDWLHQIDILRH